MNTNFGFNYVLDSPDQNIYDEDEKATKSAKCLIPRTKAQQLIQSRTLLFFLEWDIELKVFSG